jgi:hypothetical protein
MLPQRRQEFSSHHGLPPRPKTTIYHIVFERPVVRRTEVGVLTSALGRVSRALCEYPRRATIREMKEGPSGSAIRC